MGRGTGQGISGQGSRIGGFEDLIAWQEARALCREVYMATARGPLLRDFGLRDQLRRAAVSIMSNVAEGFERLGVGEKIQFLNVARASCAEVKSLLYVCLDNGSLEAEVVASLQGRCVQISRLTSGLIRSARTRKSGPISRPQAPDSDSDH